MRTNIRLLVSLCLLLYPTVAPAAGPPQASVIYHPGWIDFNKNGRKDVYEDPTAPVEKRIDDLVSLMTLEEKTCQLATLYGFGLAILERIVVP